MLVSKLSIAILDATLDFVRNFIRLLLVLATNESLQAGVAYFLRIEYSETNKGQSLHRFHLDGDQVTIEQP